MKPWLAKHGAGFVPNDSDGEKLHAQMAEGDCAEFRVVRSRSWQWHKMYQGICRVIGENQDPPRDRGGIDYELRVRAGHFDVVPMHGVEGIEIRVPKRIAFDQLSADEWAALWPSLETAIRERFGEEYIAECVQ